MRNPLGNSSHPMLDPLWRRVLLVAVVFAWSVTEFYFGDATWGTIVGVVAIYGFWSYLVAYVPSTAIVPKTPPEAGARGEE